MQLGVIGLGTMGANLARNAARNSAEVVIFNRTTEKTDEFLMKYGKEGKFVAAHTLQEFVTNLAPPRAILLMVKAGQPVDDVIKELVPLLDQGDILIDAGNSHYKDTERRVKQLQENGLRFVGMGVSGGEEGALKGPSMMPGGDEKAFAAIEPLLRKMAADDGAGGKCVAYIGPGGAGHFVKMVHNGIEYGIMQLIAEAAMLLESDLGLSKEDISKTFAAWNTQTPSFLLEITAKIFLRKDQETGKFLLDVIKDSAGQKGTGKWTTDAAMSYGVAIPTINAAVDARILSGSGDLRQRYGNAFSISPDSDLKPLSADDVRQALHLSTMMAYSQGFELLMGADAEEKWELHLGEVARVWRGGCIIRSSFLPLYQDGFSGDQKKGKDVVEQTKKMLGGTEQSAWRRTVAQGARRGLPIPGMSSALAYFDAVARDRLPQNIIQAQRDFFGAHTYERTDKPGVFHTEWL